MSYEDLLFFYKRKPLNFSSINFPRFFNCSSDLMCVSIDLYMHGVQTVLGDYTRSNFMCKQRYFYSIFNSENLELIHFPFSKEKPIFFKKKSRHWNNTGNTLWNPLKTRVMSFWCFICLQTYGHSVRKACSGKADKLYSNKRVIYR